MKERDRERERALGEKGEGHRGMERVGKEFQADYPLSMEPDIGIDLETL